MFIDLISNYINVSQGLSLGFIERVIITIQKDCREELLTKMKQSLINEFEPEDISKIISALIINSEGYEIINRTTELAISERGSEQLMKMFAGSLLTEGSRGRLLTYTFQL